MPGAILLISQLNKGSGNLHTIERIGSYLTTDGFDCSLYSPEDFSDQDISQYVAKNQIKLAIGLHAFKAGQLLQELKIPYILIIGGTDVNEFYDNTDKFSVMTKAIFGARKVIAFSHSLLKRTLELWPDLDQQKAAIVRQGVSVDPSSFSLPNYIQHHHPNIYRDDMHICICMGSIRPVKNPLFLVNAFSELHKRKPSVIYVLCGQVVDHEYGQTFKNAISSLPGVIYIPGLDLPDAHAAISQSFVFINSSNSEGMALAVLEAMLLDVPVVVRGIEGNKDIVEHGKTGLVFSTPKECIDQVESLMSDPSFRERLIKTAKQYVTKEHSMECEKKSYNDIVSSVMNTI